MSSPMGHKSGFVSILGRPNAGKSTLMNALVGQKVAIVADKPQTTRTAIQGVLTEEGVQIVFIDTPGIHRSDSSLNKRMMDAVRNSLEERDLLIFMVDASKAFGSDDERAISILRKDGPPVILAVNKVDTVKAKADLLPLMEEYSKRFDFAEYIPISAKKGASELIREKVLLATRQEVPHATNVTIEKWEETPTIVRIYATIMVERDGQKAIIIGAKGSVLKQIGTQAREEMEALFGIRIYLDLHVKVEAGWREKAAYLNTVDWRTMTGSHED
ncbi:MAG: GTPase Era [Acidobacteriia bacterium]|nr:GTPase Era [Terriglobia bacterium]